MLPDLSQVGQVLPVYAFVGFLPQAKKLIGDTKLKVNER